jgi:4-amino-4-deoxy-L-arabinose transferase-like glycosyltransferase
MSTPLAARWRKWSALGDALHHRSEEERSRHRYRTFLVVFTVAHLVLAGTLPLVADELYYWAWSRTPSLSYFDHPPMIAWWIRLGTALVGNNALGIRLLATLSATVSLALLVGIWGEARWFLLFSLTPAVLFGTLFATPDLPLFLFWAAYLRWAVELARRIERWELDPMVRAYRRYPVGFGYWAVGGVFAGLGFLSKYPMALAPALLAIALVFRFRPRGWVPGFLVHGLVAAVVALPVFVFNARLDGAPLAFQWSHAMQGGPPAFRWFLFGQALLFGLVAPILTPFLVASWRRLAADPAMAVLVPMLVVPCLFFFGKATRSFLEANWPAVTYLALVPTMQRWLRVTSFSGLWKAIFALALAPALVASALIVVHLGHRLPFLAPEKDRLREASASLAIGAETARRIAELRRPGEPVYVPTYQWTATLRWFGVDARQLPNYGRPSHFTMTEPSDPCASASALAWIGPAEQPSPLRCFTVRTSLDRFPATVDGKVIAIRELVRFERGPAP